MNTTTKIKTINGNIALSMKNDCNYITLISKTNIGKNVANRNDKKSKDCAINEGKLLTGNKIPIKIDLEKSGLGNNIKPTNNPIKD